MNNKLEGMWKEVDSRFLSRDLEQELGDRTREGCYYLSQYEIIFVFCSLCFGGLVASYTAECAFEFSYPGYVGFRK
jgi:hypothetical protein